MRLRVFQAGEGDCLLLTSADGKRVLVDGGMPDFYPDHAGPALARLRGELDLLYVSHIDNDHIGGVLEFLDDQFDWRFYDYQRQAGNTTVRPPKRPRPPAVKAIWHNAFHLQLDRNTGPIEDALAASAAVLAASSRQADRDEAAYRRELATGVSQALRVSNRVRPEELGIPLNKPFGGKLAMARDDLRPLRLGSLRLTVIGPFPEHVENLRKHWNKFLRDPENTAALDAIREEMVDDARRLESGDVDGFLGAVERRGREFGAGTTALRKRPGITPPNLASLMLMVDEGGKTVLLTGDGAGEDVVEGLERVGRLEPGGGIHVNVLKVQHHGAAANVKADFCRRVTADHYVFCGNGEHSNPEKDVLNRIVDSRLDPGARGSHAGAERPFKLWFTSSVKAAGTVRREDHMTLVEKTVRERMADSGDRMKAEFLEGDSSFEIRV